MERIIYPRPPIVEAVIDFRFHSSMGPDELADALAEKLRDAYPAERKRQDAVEFSVALQGDSFSTSAQKKQHVTFLRSADEVRNVGCGQGMVSVHALAPYPGWEQFIQQVRAVVESLPENIKHQTLSSIAVRYIDRIILPENDVPVSEYFTTMPVKPPALPEMLAGFNFATQSIDPKDGTIAIQVFASSPEEAGGPTTLVYDLTLRREGSLGTFSESTWNTVVNELHTRQRNVFEQLITDKTRALFQ